MVERRGSMLPPLLGGVLAAAVGAAVALYLFPQGWQPGTDAIDSRLVALESRPEAPDAAAVSRAIEEALGPVRARLDALEAADSLDAAALQQQMEDLTQRIEAAEAFDLDAIEQRLQGLTTRIEAAETDAPGPDMGPLERGLDEVTARLAALEETRGADITAAVQAALAEAEAAQQARAEELDATADALASEQARLSARLALTDLSVAAESGAPAPDALSRVTAVSEAPAPLGAFAEGLPTLAELQSDFPEAARRALAAAPVSQDADLGDRVLGFLRSQSGARSLAPRAGNDPDAILSRAEAAVRDGRLVEALDEIDALPPAAAAELADWRARAERRTEAIAALAEMQARLGSE
ncbi:hypothetical protein [Pararhodobacter sp. SW119]|uniref:COG4223 family protein n=1 Tax=Pararhodobacter sp. SW119 TaxID=2780075 RepID=UPI001ADF5EA4|nr:hypothetical protein [Pararhodobacter sp. SW119]